MSLPTWFTTTSLVVLVIILVLDLLLVVKRPHKPSMKEASLWVAFYVTLALLFAGCMFLLGDVEDGVHFLTGWALEYSLSIDNLFVFVLIMAQFKVPEKYQQGVLMVGIILALIFRGLFILAGVAIIEQFSFVFYIFGAFLVWTAYNQAFGGDHGDEERESWIIRTLRRRVAISSDYDENKLRTTIDGKRYWTPMLIVFIAIGSTDILFALDSIPAIFGVTTDIFIVFTANIFALMGLRQLYFLLGGLLDRLEYLKYGIAFILAFIGVKLVLHAMHANELPFINGGDPMLWAPEIHPLVSLGVIIVSMVVAIVASLIKERHDSADGKAHLHLGPAEVHVDEAGHIVHDSRDQVASEGDKS